MASPLFAGATLVSAAERRAANAQKLAALETENQSLKAQIEQIRQEKSDAKLAELAKGQVSSIPRLDMAVRRTLRGHFNKVYEVQWCERDNFLVSASQDGKLIIWNPLTQFKVFAITLSSNFVITCSYAASGRFVASGGLDNVCSIYRLHGQDDPSKSRRELRGHTGYVSRCRFVSDEQIITSSGDSTCMLWDVETAVPIRSFTGHSSDVITIAISPNRNMFVSGGCDKLAKLWDTRQEKCVTTFDGHLSDINATAYFPDGNAFATGSDDGSCRLWDVRASSCINEYEKKQNPCGVTCLCFSRGGRMLFTAYDDASVVAWDSVSGGCVGNLPSGEHQQRVSCMELSPDGFALCTASWDHLVRIWS